MRLNVTRKSSASAPPALPIAPACESTQRPARWAAADSADTLEPLWRLLEERGAGCSAAPGTSALEHALRCASLAREAGADAALVTASLLHDIGHLLRADFCVPGSAGGRERHAMIGAAFASLWFGPAVTEPIRLHGEAKRYLCAVEPRYLSSLHPGARASLERNGGAMTPDEARAFIAGPHARAAILLRRWDDRADVDCVRPGTLARFRKLAERCRAAGAG